MGFYSYPRTGQNSLTVSLEFILILIFFQVLIAEVLDPKINWLEIARKLNVILDESDSSTH